MKFREHRGSLSDSMATVIEVEDFDALYKHLSDDLHRYKFTFSKADLKVEKYTYDARIEWDTHLVTIEGYGVAGMTDGPC